MHDELGVAYLERVKVAAAALAAVFVIACMAYFIPRESRSEDL